MRLAKSVGKNPREIAQTIVDAIPDSNFVDKTEIAGPGFINFHVSRLALQTELEEVLRQGLRYGHQEQRAEPRILLEFVSANPTGPLHVGHGRHASYGATLGNLLDAAGHNVDREYYVNDAGRQMDILGVSVILRALEDSGDSFEFPEAGYKGEYIREISNEIDTRILDDISANDLFDGIPEDSDKEAIIGKLIENAERELGLDGFLGLRKQSLDSILNEMKEDLAEFGVTFDRWFSEQSLTDDGLIDDALAVLNERRMLYEKDGATWFRATDFGDEKDRVVVRENGKKTYFASDIAYHYGKRQRNYDLLLDILGSDHHGYVARVQAGLEAMGYAGDSLEVELMQFVTLYRGGEKMQMSTRSGEFVTMRQLREEVGNDAARFFYVMRSNEQHLDFDLDLAASQSDDNPVYYVQYACARVASILRRRKELGLDPTPQPADVNLGLLQEPQEMALLINLSRYPEVVELAATNRAPQHIVHYLRELAATFHTFYNAQKVLVDDGTIRDARTLLALATQQVLTNGLGLLGVSAPEEM